MFYISDLFLSGRRVLAYFDPQWRDLKSGVANFKI
jgi:hypothetical protein